MSTFNLSKRIKIVVPSSNVDSMYGPYNSVSAANAAIISGVREKGKTVGVLINGGVVEYWWKSGIADSDLVLKTAESGGNSPFSLNSNNTGIQSGNNIASGSHSLAIGTNSKASDYGALVTGQYNSLGSSATSANSFSTANTAFVIGNGTSSNAKSDAFSVLFNGTTKTKNLTLGSVTEMSGVGSLDTVFTLQNLSTSAGLNTAQFFDISRAPSSNTPNATSYAALYRIQTSENSNFDSGALIGFNGVARHKANGDTSTITGAINTAEVVNTNTISSGLLTGAFNQANVKSSSASGNITLLEGAVGSYNNVTIGDLDANEEPVQSQQTVSHSDDNGSIYSGLNVFRAYNPNFTSQSVAAGSNELDIKAGNLDELEVSRFNVFSFPNKIDASLSIGQFSYLKIEEDGVIPRVTGSSYAINSRSPLLSKFNGALDVTGGIAERLSGTVITNGTTSVSGTNTLFSSELSVGDKVRINNTIRTVNTISNNSTLTLDQTLPAVLNSNDVNENQYIYKAEKIIKLKSNDEVEKFSVDAQGAVNIVSSATAGSFIKQGGTSSQYLMADGSISTSSGGGAFEEITESGKTGIRQTGVNASFYGDIGTGAVDLSYSNGSSTTRGATGDYSVAMGYNPTASGDYSTATGQATIASGNYSTAMGEGSEASGTSSTATGRYTEASGNYSTATGRDTVASGNNSTAMGYQTEAIGFASTTLGQSTATSNRAIGSLVSGTSSIANAENCLSSGFHTIVTGFSGTAIGNYNEDTSTSYNNFSTSNNAFMIGNGDTEQRSNCFEVKFSGATVIYNTVTATNFILSSDKKLKNNIEEIDTNHIDVNWKNFELKSEPGVKRAGVIAQELEEIHPEFVRTDSKGIKSVAYIDLLIAKIAELEARLEKLEK